MPLTNEHKQGSDLIKSCVMSLQIKPFAGVFPNIFPVLITYMISSPDVEDYAKEQNIALYYSYDC